MKQTTKQNRRIPTASELKEIEELRFIAKCNEASAKGHAERKARQEERLEITKRMKDCNMDISTIAELTGFTTDEIIKL